MRDLKFGSHITNCTNLLDKPVRRECNFFELACLVLLELLECIVLVDLFGLLVLMELLALLDELVRGKPLWMRPFFSSFLNVWMH